MADQHLGRRLQQRASISWGSRAARRGCRRCRPPCSPGDNDTESARAALRPSRFILPTSTCVPLGEPPRPRCHLALVTWWVGVMGLLGMWTSVSAAAPAGCLPELARESSPHRPTDGHACCVNRWSCQASEAERIEKGKEMAGKRSKMHWMGPHMLKNRKMGPTQADVESFKILESLL